MPTVCAFCTKFASLIVCVFSCFDRVIFQGHLQINRVSEIEKFVDYVLQIRRCEFAEKVGPAWSERLVEHARVMRVGRVARAWSDRQDPAHKTVADHAAWPNASGDTLRTYRRYGSQAA